VGSNPIPSTLIHFCMDYSSSDIPRMYLALKNKLNLKMVKQSHSDLSNLFSPLA
jgi:hypothetical protein